MPFQKDPFDFWTLMHADGGAGIAAIGLPPQIGMPAIAAFEILEQPFINSSESTENLVVDLIVGLAAYYVTWRALGSPDWYVRPRAKLPHIQMGARPVERRQFTYKVVG